mgnify:CR=1 FL=1
MDVVEILQEYEMIDFFLKIVHEPGIEYVENWKERWVFSYSSDSMKQLFENMNRMIVELKLSQQKGLKKGR